MGAGMTWLLPLAPVCVGSSQATSTHCTNQFRCQWLINTCSATWWHISLWCIKSVAAFVTPDSVALLSGSVFDVLYPLCDHWSIIYSVCRPWAVSVLEAPNSPCHLNIVPGFHGTWKVMDFLIKFSRPGKIWNFILKSCSLITVFYFIY